MIGIIDYGMGNLYSVKNALDYIGAKALISSDPAALASCDKLILPGVGAFPQAMERLKETGLDVFVKAKAGEGVPLLGICLGMQLLFDKSYEFTECEGLSLIGGTVERMSAEYEGEKLKIPHMGWNSLTLDKNCPILSGLNNGDFVYFVHSYKAHLTDPADLAAHTVYDGAVTAVVARGNIFGAQFHPEKSGEVGLRILRNFAALQ